jgi:nicotinamidase-related amidase
MVDYTAPERGHTALLTVNAQCDFVASGSPLRACGASAVVPVIERLVKGARAQKVPIIHAVRLYRPDGTNVDCFRRQAVEEGLRVLMPGTHGAELVKEVKPGSDVRLEASHLIAGNVQELGSNEWAIYKPRWGAFHGTKLDALLNSLGVTTVIVCGFNFSTSGRATVYEAGARDFRIVLVPDAVSGASEQAIAELGRIGVYLMTADNCLGWLRNAKASETAVA